jgi:hypothetical protein
MTAFPMDVRFTPKSGIARRRLNVRFVPKADIDLLIDHLVGAGKQCRWHRDTESLSGLKIDGQFILSRCLHWHVGRFLALENAIDIRRRTPMRVDRIMPLRH